VVRLAAAEHANRQHMGAVEGRTARQVFLNAAPQIFASHGATKRSGSLVKWPEVMSATPVRANSQWCRGLASGDARIAMFTRPATAMMTSPASQR
jgi:hypothetical protein